VKHVSDYVAIMYLGRFVESGPTEEIFNNPAHPYTRALLQAVPVPDPRERRELQTVLGETPSPVSPPSGCHFHPRCPFAVPACSENTPPFEPVAPSAGDRHQQHLAACIRKHEI
jgi:oligopeptide/dipeptide ABC transporter ATP-binding protein